ncbi:hypothetical protein BJV82DRAFT_593823 [Fennellomyces sp. T-0311]|nr:hypothetical protein BJV82DRAFT_593823 [Fennellomyces sp. T-0311]
MVHNSTASSSSGDSSSSSNNNNTTTTTTTTASFRHNTTAPSTPSSHHSMDDDDQEDLGYWVQRCSICFDAQLDLCLEYCRDQYCLDCFRRYVTEVVTSSWGLSVTKIRCPVCQDHIPQSEWSKFVPTSVVEHYNRYNQPYRSFSRCCPQCETEVAPCDYRDRHQGGPKRVYAMLKELLNECPHDEEDPRHRAIRQLLPVIDWGEWSNSTLPELYQQTITAVMAFEDHLGRSHKTAQAVSKSMLLFDMKPDTYKKLQFQHIAFFPTIDCPSCRVTFCLQCGQREHLGATCEQSMQTLVDGNKYPTEAIETIRWQLKNSRRCPNCSIMINRDEGCNKVDCSLCGFCFCWACRSPWSEKCGFYHCAESKTTDPGSSSPELSEAKTELGVPNVWNFPFVRVHND